MPIKLFILGGAKLHRDGLALQLESYPSVKVIGAGMLDDAVRSLRSTPADVALLDTVQLEIPAAVDALRQSLRQQFIENHAECIHVAADIKLPRVSQDLLGAHIWDRANELTGIRFHRDRLDVGLGEPRHAEVEDFGDRV